MVQVLETHSSGAQSLSLSQAATEKPHWPGEQTPSPQSLSASQAPGVQSARVGVRQTEMRLAHFAGASRGRSPQQSSSSEHSTRSQCFASTETSKSFLEQVPFTQARPPAQSLRASQVSPRAPRPAGVTVVSPVEHDAIPAITKTSSKLQSIRMGSSL